MINIAFGTKSEQKNSYLKGVVNEFDIQLKITSYDVCSGISEQPLSDKETKRGAINRAKSAYKLSADANYGLGLEIGYQPIGSGYDILCWAILWDGENIVSSYKSEHIRLPVFHSDIIRNGGYLGDHVQLYIDNAVNKFEKEIGIIIKTREPFIKESLKEVLKHLI